MIELSAGFRRRGLNTSKYQAQDLQSRYCRFFIDNPQAAVSLNFPQREGFNIRSSISTLYATITALQESFAARILASRLERFAIAFTVVADLHVCAGSVLHPTPRAPHTRVPLHLFTCPSPQTRSRHVRRAYSLTF